MKFVRRVALIILSIGVFLGSTVNASATTKVLRYKNLESSSYAVVKGTKGYMYKTANLKTRIHNIKNYSKSKFIVKKEAIIKKSNGTKSVYYYAKNSKVSGWVWHGSLKKVIQKKSNAEITDLKQQISDLQQQLNNLKNHPVTVSNNSTISNDSTLQSQINVLQNQLVNLKNETKPAVSASNNDPWSGVAHENYIFPDQRVFIYKDNQVHNDMIVNKGIEISRIAGNVKATDHLLKVYPDNAVNGMYPCEYNGIKGYVQATDVTGINADDSKPQVYMNSYENYESNVKPTEVSIDASLLHDTMGWSVYTQDGWAGYGWRNGKWNLEDGNNWAGTDPQG